MDCDPDTLTRLLLDPCLTTDEARREAAALGRKVVAIEPEPRTHPDRGTVPAAPQRRWR